MTGRDPVLVELLKRSARLTGPGVVAAAEAVGAPRMRDASRRAYLVPIDFAGDVIAHLEHCQRRRVQIVDTTAQLVLPEAVSR